ncbi:MAG: Ig-like domain-containing protein [Bacilli bacterium]|jgi:hypothetical protein
MKRISAILSLAVMSISLLAGCGDDTVHVTGLQIMPDSVELSIGAEAETEQLDVSFAPADAPNKEVTWSTENAAIATVDATGIVTAVAEGTTNVVVTSNDSGKTAKCEVSITEYTALEAAAEAINLVLYPNISTTGVTTNFDLITEVVYLGYTFQIVYTAVNDPLTKGYLNTYIEVGVDGDECVITPPFSNEFDDDYAMCRLNASVLYNSAATGVTKNYNVRVNTLTIIRVSEIYSSNGGKGLSDKAGVAFDAYFLGAYSGNSYNGVFVGDGESAVLLYGYSNADLLATFTTSTILRIIGSISVFYGLMEVKPESIEVIASSPDIEVPVAKVLNDSATISFPDQNRLVSLSGTVTSNDKGEGHSGITIVVSTGTKEYQVYVKQADVSAADYTTFQGLNVSDVVSLTGFVGKYNETYQVVGPTLVVD